MDATRTTLRIRHHATLLTLTLSLIAAPAAMAQDAATQAAQQAQQQAVQQAQQASDAAMRANQQAMQDSMNAAQTTPGWTAPPRQRPTVPVTPHGPIPARIAAAHTIFVANLGAAPNAPMDMTTAYEQLSRELAAWGHYRLADSPEQADLIFELREVAPLTRVDGVNGDVNSYTTPAFELHIRDAKTQVVLWTLLSPIENFGKRSELPHWNAMAVTNLVSRVKVLTATPLTAQEIADLTAVPRTHFGRNAAIVTGVTVGAGLAAGLLLHHAYENSVASQKQQQDQFCLAHGIPLDQCAGG